jgi:hypothetical protein
MDLQQDQQRSVARPAERLEVLARMNHDFLRAKWLGRAG